MNRRSFLQRFLGGLAGTAALSAIDVDKLLWMPGEKTIFLPSGENGVTVDWVRREALRILQKNLTFASSFNREYDAPFLRRDAILNIQLGRIAA